VQRHLAALDFWRGATVAALYDAASFEVPTAGLQREDLRVCLPRVERGTRVLTFIDGETPVALSDIDVWVVPGVAFTRQGLRLGRGGGYYDTTLALARPDAVTVGLAFECCVVDGLPTEAHDRAVDWLVTEAGATRCRPG
jgi:5-formyltetrahydrofolate cyclo-ligase